MKFIPKKTIKSNISGITLVALVITIVVLLILAGITINMIVGKNGILKKTISAKEQIKEAEKEEQSYMEHQIAIIEKYNKNYDNIDTFEIYTITDLILFQYLTTEEGGNHKFEGVDVNLMKDIDISSIDWIPIYGFLGNFNGNNHSIIGLTSKTNGLFESIGNVQSNNDVTIKNLNLVNININTSTKWNVGGLVGFVNASAYTSLDKFKIINCHVTGNINAVYNVGGIIGNLGESTINCSSFNGNVTAKGSAVGGIVGQCTYQGCHINNSYFIGEVNTLEDYSSKTGSILGCNYSGGIEISNCYAYNLVLNNNGYGTVGTIIGGIGGSWIVSKTTVKDCYVNNKYNVEYETVGGYNSFEKVTILDKSEFSNKQNFPTMDFDSIWEIRDSIPKIIIKQY